MKTTPRLVLGVLASLILLAGCHKENATKDAAADLPETQPAIQTAVSTNVNNNIGGFYKALPARYDSGTKKYPLLVFLHGVGELGNGTTDLPKVLANGVPRLLSQQQFPVKFTADGNDFSFIVISPQFKAWPQPSDINSLIDYAIKNFRIDTTRMYVSGLSMGGGNTWDYAIAYPNRIAATVPICGASWPSQAQCQGIASSGLPVWAFHNDDDGTVGSGTTKMIVGFINSFNPNPQAQMTIWPTGGHDAWTKATNPATKECNGKNMYEWMLQYSRVQ